jgi:tetratricopeptide (TPR) repeat protein
LGILGQYEQVANESEAAGKWFDNSHDDLGRARLLTNIGNVHQRREDYEQAIECLGLAHELFKSIGDETMLAVSKSNLAICLCHLGRLDAAEAMFSQAEKLSLKLRLADLSQQIRYNYNYLLFLRGHCEEALERFQELKRAFRQQKDARHVALCDLDIALIYLHSDMPAAALRYAKKAADAFPKLHMRYEQAKALAYAGAALIQTHRFKKSLSALYSAQALFRLERNNYWMTVLDVWQSYVCHAVRNSSMARALLNRARFRLDQIDAHTKRIETVRSILSDCEDKPKFLSDLKTADLIRLIN